MTVNAVGYTSVKEKFGDRKLVSVRVDGDDLATVQGFLTDEEIEALGKRCSAVGVSCYIEPLDLPVGLEALLDEQDVSRAQDIRSILERREKDNG